MPVWTIEVSASADKQLRKLNPQARRRIEKYVDERVLTCENPKILAKKIAGTDEEL